MDLALWVSDYYLAGPGDTLAAAMPPGAWIESQRRFRLTAAGTGRPEAADDGTPRRQVLARLAKGPKTLRGRADAALASLEREGLIERVTAMSGRARAFRTTRHRDADAGGHRALRRAQRVAPDATLGARQRAALAALAATGQPQPVGALREHGVDLGTLRRLAARGYVHLHEEVSERDPFAGGAVPIVDRDEDARADRRAGDGADDADGVCSTAAPIMPRWCTASRAAARPSSTCASPVTRSRRAAVC